MEILQTIWNALATPNEGLIKLFGIPFIFIEITTSMLLAFNILNVQSNTKQRVLYVFSLSSIAIFLNFFVPDPYRYLIRLLLNPLLMIVIFKTTLIKSFIAEILPMLIGLIIELLFTNIYIFLFDLTYEQITTIPIYRESIIFSVYFGMYLIYILSKKFNLNISLLDFMDKRNKIILTTNFAFGIIAIIVQV